MAVPPVVAASAAAPDAAAAAGRFAALSYNILAHSLGSNCIPWVMTASAEFREAVSKATGQAWGAWKTGVVLPEYMRHFHKNPGSGDYPGMRQFWSARRCASQDDIPTSLTGIRFVDQDLVSYVDSSSGEPVTARTLRGLLRAALGDGDGGLGEALFDHVMREEDEVYDWRARGPRIFREVTSPRSVTTVSGEGATVPPDIVVLQEYDVFDKAAEYRPGAGQETFAAAMSAAGYSHVLFQEPNPARLTPSGLGLFWRSAAFQLAEPNGGGEVELPFRLRCGTSSPGGGIHNVDCDEHWHRWTGGGTSERQRMADADRRSFGLARLRHIASGRPLWVITCHLMTQSRDGPKTNEFPGEVRAAELRAMREAVARLLPQGEPLLIAGDFNTEALRFEEVLGGRIPSRGQSGGEMRIATGLARRDDAAGPPACAGAGAPRGTALRFEWEAGGAPLELSEVFEPVHRWGMQEAPRCTSVNAERAEWIDFMWYSDGMLSPVATAEVADAREPMPTRTKGSDHVPIAAVFEFAAPACGGARGEGSC